MILLIMNCCSAAEYVVASFDHPRVKVCPFHLASAQTKETARKSKGLPFSYFCLSFVYCWNITVSEVHCIRAINQKHKLTPNILFSFLDH